MKMLSTKVGTLFDTQELKERLGLNPEGRVQQVIDKSVIDWGLQYVPWDTGTLGKSPYVETKIGSGIVKYAGPYARYLYYGEVYGPNIPIFDDNSGEPSGYWSPPEQEKLPTGRQLQFDTSVNPMAGPFWFEREKADHLQDIIDEARAAVGR